MVSTPAVRFVLAKTYFAIRVSARLVLIVAAIALALPVSANDSGADAAQANDAWRRTANGWELINRWHEQSARYSAVPAIRIDGHPAALALLQSLAVVGAFALFPPRRTVRSGMAA